MTENDVWSMFAVFSVILVILAIGFVAVYMLTD